MPISKVDSSTSGNRLYELRGKQVRQESHNDRFGLGLSGFSSESTSSS